MDSFASATDSEVIEDTCVTVLVSSAHGGDIKDATPLFEEHELTVIVDEAKLLADLVMKGERVLIVCRGGETRSAFLAHLVKLILDNKSFNAFDFDAPYPVCEVLKTFLTTFHPN